MKFGSKSEPKKCARCYRTKEEALTEQKEKGCVCSDPNCTFKRAIQSALTNGNGSPRHSFIWQHCPDCGRQYYRSYSKYCYNCGKKRK